MEPQPNDGRGCSDCAGGDERVGSALQNYVVIGVRLGCGNDGQVILFGLFLSALTALLLRFLRHGKILARTHKPRVTRSIRVTATTFKLP